MIFIYRKDDGVVVNATMARTVSDCELLTMVASVAHKHLTDNKGNPIILPKKSCLGEQFVEDTVSSLKYLYHLFGPGKIPRFKFLLSKSGLPLKLVPVSGKLPKGWDM